MAQKIGGVGVSSQSCSPSVPFVFSLLKLLSTRTSTHACANATETVCGRSSPSQGNGLAGWGALLFLCISFVSAFRILLWGLIRSCLILCSDDQEQCQEWHFASTCQIPNASTAIRNAMETPNLEEGSGKVPW